MDELQVITPPVQSEETLAIQESTPAQPAETKKLEGIEHDPYQWGQCAITASIVWLPDGSVLLGARNHLDAPLISVLSGEALITLPGHAAELPIPSAETIADLLGQLREELPLRAQAKTERDETARRKAEAVQTKPTSGKKTAKPATAVQSIQPTTASVSIPTPLPAKSPPVGKAPAATQVSLFNFMTGGN
jgi:hypothetical protein